MTPVDQEFLHKPEIGQYGDCMRAVLASLLDFPIADVPHFAQIEADGGQNFWFGVSEFCASHGFEYVQMPSNCIKWHDGDLYHEISGPSPRGNGIYHAVVGCNGKIAHDPHPSRDGLAGDPSEWEFSFLVRK